MTSVSKLANIRRFLSLPPQSFVYLLPVSTGWDHIVFALVLPAQTGQPQRCLPVRGVNGRLPDMTESALPPDLFSASGRDHLRCQHPVQYGHPLPSCGRKPLRSTHDCFHSARKLFHDCPVRHSTARAVHVSHNPTGSTAFLFDLRYRSRIKLPARHLLQKCILSGVQLSRFRSPTVSGAVLKYGRVCSSFRSRQSGRCAAHHAHFRRQLTVVKLWMSLGGNVGRDSRKIVIPHEHFAPCTVGAALLARCVERGTHGK